MNFAALRAIARHRFLMLIIAEQEITSRIEAERTLRDGQMLQEVRVDEKSLCCIDKWIEYANEALEEADRVERKRVQWAELVEVWLFLDELENDSASNCEDDKEGH